MGRRPLLPYSAGLRRRDSRMAPGGRMYSESPMTGRLGGMSAGVPVPLPEAPLPVYAWNAYINEGETSVTMDWATRNMSAAYLDGYVTVALCWGYKVGLDAPANWTVLREGTVGDLSYWVGWRRHDGTDTAITIDITGVSPGWTWPPAPDIRGMTAIECFLWGSDWIAPDYEDRPPSPLLYPVATSGGVFTADPTITVQTPDPEWLSSTNYYMCVPTTPEAAGRTNYWIPEPPNDWNDYLNTSQDYYITDDRAGHAVRMGGYWSFVIFDFPPDPPPALTVTMVDTENDPIDGDWVTFAIGWTV